MTVDSTITGVGKYAFDLYRLMKSDSQIIQIIFNNKYLDRNYKEPVMGTRFPVINYPLAGLVYNKTMLSRIEFLFKDHLNIIVHSLED